MAEFLENLCFLPSEKALSTFADSDFFTQCRGGAVITEQMTKKSTETEISTGSYRQFRGELFGPNNKLPSIIHMLLSKKMAINNLIVYSVEHKLGYHFEFNDIVN